jgi:hypothetical protein
VSIQARNLITVGNSKTFFAHALLAYGSPAEDFGIKDRQMLFAIGERSRVCQYGRKTSRTENTFEFSLISHVREHKNNLFERFEVSQNPLCIRPVSDLYPMPILRISYVYPPSGF